MRESIEKQKKMLEFIDPCIVTIYKEEITLKIESGDT